MPAATEMMRRAIGYVFPWYVIANAAERGNQEAVQWLYPNGVCDFHIAIPLEKAASKRHLHVVAWLMQHGRTVWTDFRIDLWFDSKIQVACWRYGQYKYSLTPLDGLTSTCIVRDCYTQPYPLLDPYTKVGDQNAIESIAFWAAAWGQTVHQLYTDDAPCLAAEFSHWGVLQWLWEQGERQKNVERVFNGAVKGGQIEMMIKLEPELPSTASMVDTFVAACTAGQLEALKWLETKYPNTAVNWSHLLGQAMRNDRLEVMKYIKATKTTTFSTEDLGEVGCSGSYSTIEFVFSHSTRAEMLEVASRGCTVNSEYEVRRWCGQGMESTWVSPTYFLSILNRED